MTFTSEKKLKFKKNGSDYKSSQRQSIINKKKISQSMSSTSNRLSIKIPKLKKKKRNARKKKKVARNQEISKSNLLPRSATVCKMRKDKSKETYKRTVAYIYI